MPRLQYSADDLYTTSIRVTQTGEIPASSTAARINDASLAGTVSIDVNTWMITAVITTDMLEDSVFPLDAFLANKFKETVDLLYDNMILNGIGGGQPDGILNKAVYPQTDPNRPVVLKSNTGGGIDYNALIDVMTELPPQYEDGATWIMGKKTGYRSLNKLVDGQSRPIFTMGYNDSGIVDKRARMLLGDPVTISQFMPAVSSSTYPIIYCDPRGYYHVDRVGFSIQVLREVGAELNQVRIVGRIRFGGACIEPFRFKILKSNNS